MQKANPLRVIINPAKNDIGLYLNVTTCFPESR